MFRAQFESRLSLRMFSSACRLSWGPWYLDQLYGICFFADELAPKRMQHVENNSHTGRPRHGFLEDGLEGHGT